MSDINQDFEKLKQKKEEKDRITEEVEKKMNRANQNKKADKAVNDDVYGNGDDTTNNDVSTTVNKTVNGRGTGDTNGSDGVTTNGSTNTHDNNEVVLESKPKQQRTVKRQTYYISFDLIEQLEEYSEKSGYNKSELVRLALRDLFDRLKIKD